MKISGVQAQLNGQDILSIIKEFLEVEGLNLKKIEIDNEINIEGSFTKGVVFDFEGALAIEGVKDGKIYARFSRLKLFKLGIFRMVRSFAIKTALKHLQVSGIEASKDVLILDINKLLQDVPYVSLNIKNLFVKDNLLWVDVEEVIISIKGQLIKDKEEEIQEMPQESIDIEAIEKTKDSYSVGRKVLEDKLPERAKKASGIIFLLPDLTALVIRLLKDKRVPLKTKVSVSAAVAYIFFPTDLIPDKIPFIGKIDELAVLLFALNRIACDVDLKVIVENWEGKNDLLLTLKTGLDYLVNFTGAKNVEKLYNLVDELRTL